MLSYLNYSLRRFFESNLHLKTEQIDFEPPDDTWRTYIEGLTSKIGLNVYLVDLRESCSRRSNETLHKRQNGFASETLRPRWMDCHYLISAWDRSTAAIASGNEPTLTEHALLYAVAAALMKSDTLIPREVYKPDPLPTGFPAILADVELPVAVVPPEGFPKLAEFWGSMGAGYRWKPVVYLIVTLPIMFDQETVTAMVTTLVTRFGQTKQDIPDVFLTIGGSVLDTQHPLPNNDPAPLKDVEVRLEISTGELQQTVKTDEQGHFTFTGLREGQYQLCVHVQPLAEKIIPLDLQAESHGSGMILYDVRL
jgi:hypothetical protein